jgi:hypothetical protein
MPVTILQICPAPRELGLDSAQGIGKCARELQQSLLLIHAFDGMIIVLYYFGHGIRKQEFKTKL